MARQQRYKVKEIARHTESSTRWQLCCLCCSWLRWRRRLFRHWIHSQEAERATSYNGFSNSEKGHWNEIRLQTCKFAPFRSGLQTIPSSETFSLRSQGPLLVPIPRIAAGSWTTFSFQSLSMNAWSRSHGTSFHAFDVNLPKTQILQLSTSDSSRQESTSLVLIEGHK